jgi:hypothetical protein
MTADDHLRRYTAVIQLQTTAVDAQFHYRSWPNALRLENLEQAAQIDELCSRAWCRHNRFVLVGNQHKHWVNKATMAKAAIRSVIDGGNN